MVGDIFDLKSSHINLRHTEHGHGHSHTSVKDDISEPNGAIAMEATGTIRRSFSVAAEEYSLGDIVRLILLGLSH